MDENLAQQIQKGEKQALALLVERHHSPLLGYLYRMKGGDRALAGGAGRLRAGDATMRVHRQGKTVDLTVTLPAADPSTAATLLGLRMRDVPGVGTTVLRVDPRSAASLARLQEGDLITLAGNITAPTAAQLGNVFRSAGTGEAIMLAVTRGRTHLVVGLVK